MQILHSGLLKKSKNENLISLMQYFCTRCIYRVNTC